MEKKNCNQSGKDDDSNYNEKVEEIRDADNMIKREWENKEQISDIVRYVVGAIFILGSISNLIKGNLRGIIELLFAISLMPFVYRRYIYKYIKRNRVFKITQVVLPIVLMMAFFLVTPSDKNAEIKSKYTPSDNDTAETTSDDSATTTEKDEDDEEMELTESDKMLLKLEPLMDEKLAFDTGDYIQGDIPSGEYAFVKLSGNIAYYSEKDSSENIIENEIFDSFGYVKVHAAGNLTTDGVLININAFGKLGVTSAKQIYEALHNLTDYHEGGYYKVGVDIPAGQYVLESYGRGYWAVMTGPVGSSDIIKNDNYNGRALVNVRDGQYLEITNSFYTKQ